MTCPKCGSDDWKLASFIHQSGITNINTSTNTTGIGIGLGHNGLGVGIGNASGSTSGTHQTQLSSMASPPVLKKYQPIPYFQYFLRWLGSLLLILIFSVLALLLIDNNGHEPVLWGLSITELSMLTTMVVLFSISTILFWKSFKQIKKKLENHNNTFLEFNKTAVKNWEATQVCLRCGNFYLPSNI